MNRVSISVILQIFILLLVSCFQPIHAAELHEFEKDLAGIAESDPGIYQQMIDAGAKILIMKGCKPFIVYWIPEGFDSLLKRRILVIMHGTNGNAYRHLSNFLNIAKKHKFGILSVQWGWPTDKRTLRGKTQYKYIQDPRDTYALIKAGLTYLDQQHEITQDECA